MPITDVVEIAILAANPITDPIIGTSLLNPDCLTVSQTVNQSAENFIEYFLLKFVATY